VKYSSLNKKVFHKYHSMSDCHIDYIIYTSM